MSMFQVPPAWTGQKLVEGSALQPGFPPKDRQMCGESWECLVLSWPRGAGKRLCESSSAQGQGWGAGGVSSGRACGYESGCHQAAPEVTPRPELKASSSQNISSGSHQKPAKLSSSSHQLRAEVWPLLQQVWQCKPIWPQHLQ